MRAGVVPKASRRCSLTTAGRLVMGPADRNPGMTEARAGRVQSEMEIRPDRGRVRALCAQGSGEAESSSPPELSPGAKLLLRKRATDRTR